MCDNERGELAVVERMEHACMQSLDTSARLTDMVAKLGAYIAQLDARLRAQEDALSDRVTISHDQQKALMACIRRRAEEMCVKYGLPDKALAPLRTRIRRDVMARFAVKDLHDIPLRMLPDATHAVSAWDSYIAILHLRRGRHD